ncbi:hypothetical protein [Kineococcus sp. SYSU DK005]|uniref:hypothetical protein n=1 Tax=Kineococcus sp. SYSU DK005 TaxID=3383126 RepID=UPI003D7EF969
MSSAISSSFDRELGALVHGPCVLSTGPGIGIGLRCAFAHLDGLLLSIEVKATGQAARNAHDSDSLPRSGRSGLRPSRTLPYSSARLSVPASAAGTTPDGQPWLRLEHHSDRRAHTARRSSGDDPGTPAYVQDLDLWWPDLPADARLPLEAGWPELGAPMTTTVLVLENLDDLAEKVVRLG